MKTLLITTAALLLASCGAAPTTANEAAAAPALPAETVPTDVAAAPSPAVPLTDAPEATSAGEEQTRIEKLAGDWRVTGVEVAPGPVQAVVKNDPSLMGAVLQVSPARLSWKPGKSGFEDSCPEPQLGPDNSIGCAEGQFGPPDATLVETDNRIRLDWYDGAILTLSRE